LIGGLYARLAVFGVGLVLVGGLYWHYSHLRSEAAKVPELEREIAEQALLAQDNLAAYLTAEAARHELQSELLDWEASRNSIIGALRYEIRNAPIAVDPVCAPSELDRRMRNTAIDQLIAGAGTEPITPVPAPRRSIDDNNQ